MKNTQSFPRIVLMALALGTASVTGAFAQTTPATPTTPAPTTPTTPATPTGKGGKHNLDAVLTPAEKAQYEKDMAAALAANPALQTEADSLKAQHKALKKQGDSASADDKQALKAQIKEHAQKVQVAMLKLDPSVAPILAKIKAAHKEAKHATANA
jgi:hypothetical protein